jgi:hypothetical protein
MPLMFVDDGRRSFLSARFPRNLSPVSACLAIHSEIGNWGEC